MCFIVSASKAKPESDVSEADWIIDMNFPRGQRASGQVVRPSNLPLRLGPDLPGKLILYAPE